MYVHRGMCATEDRQKRGQECDPVTVRRTARLSVLVGRERLGVFLPVCVCHVKTSIELQGESTDERRQGSTKEQELDRVCYCVCACP